jgi:hypothetical protein
LIISNVIARLPEPISDFSIFIPFYLFLIPALKQLNNYWASEALDSISQKITTVEIIILVIGGLFMALILIGLFVG